MKHEILFRGRRIDTGDWVEGHFFRSSTRAYIITMVDDTGTWAKSPRLLFAEVDPDTVGQFTGLVDKHGKKIFKDDLAQANGVKKYLYRIATGLFHPEGLSYQHGIFTSQVKTLCGVHGIETKSGRPCFLGFNPDENGNTAELEVIGNAWDNPELLGKGESA